MAKYCSEKLKPLHLAFIDVAKAFDSVSHHSLLAAAHRLGLPSRLNSYTQRLYTGITTTLKVGEERSNEIFHVRRGIRQGDPMSPILFNACIDWCLEGTSSSIGFETPEGDVLSHLAFADDIVLFAQTPKGLNDQVNRLASEMAKCGLALNTKKSMSYSQMVDGKKKKWVWGTEPCVTVGGKPLDPVLPGETYKYLGTAFAGEKGNSRPLQIIGKGLHNITVAPLKPQQRMTVLRTYLIPQIYHIVVLDHVTGKQLENMDYKVRSAVRQWLKMPADTPVGFFHSEVKAGGLGIPRLKTSVPAQRAYRFGRLLKSNDPVVSFVMRTRLMLKLAIGKAHLGGAPLPAPARQQVKSEQAEELYHSIDGSGLQPFRSTHALAHDWLRDPARFKLSGRAYIKMIAIRGGIVPTPARLARGRPERDRQCKACGTSATLNHIQQKCLRTHGARITRHDRIVDLVCEGLTRRGWEVSRETRLPLPTRTVIPDIIARMGVRTVVLDVTVVGDLVNVELAAQAKVTKYSGEDIVSHLLEGGMAAGTQGDADSISVHGLAWNWRGALANASFRAMKEVGFSRQLMSLTCLRAVQGSEHVVRFHQKTTFQAYWEDGADEDAP